MAAQDQSTTVSIPERLASRVEDRLPQSEFDAVDEYVTFVLEEVLVSVEDAEDDGSGETIDSDAVEARLESLGYLE